MLRLLRGRKPTRRNSKWIADLFKHNLVPCSFIPPADIRALRDICRYRYKLVNNRTGEKNRVQNCMTVSNIGIDKIVTDPFGKSATNIMQYLIENNNAPINEEYFKSLLKKTLKSKADILLESVKDSIISNDQLFKLKVMYHHIDNINTYIKLVEEYMTDISSKFQVFIDLACQVPGISILSAIWIIGEIGINMEIFKDASHLTSWAGLTPANNESAGKKHSTRVSKAGVYIKPLLIQCALCAIRDSKNNYYHHKYINIKKRRGHKKAIIAIARMMLTAIFYMFSTGESFNPYDYEYYNKPRSFKRVILNNSNVLNYLNSLGLDVSGIAHKLNELSSSQPT